jgi:transposase-like protein
MHGSRPQISRGQRHNWWARQVARQQATNIPVLTFCRQLGVPTSTFYDWKRRFTQARATPPQPERLTRPSPKPIGHEQAGTVATSFVPVSIKNPAPEPQLEIELANACVVRVKGAIDRSLLEAAIAAAAKLDSPSRGGR